MPVTVICVGKLRERFFADAAAEYLKRLRRLMPVTVIEVPDEPEPAQPGDAQNEVVLRREGERILARLTDRDHVIALCVDAKQYESPELAARLDVLRERLVANRDLHEDGDGALCLPDGTRLADLSAVGTVGDLLQDGRLTRLAGAVVGCATGRD